ncbi:hypothetical protein DIURU_001567 [Diutina rugosa]|uniref:Small nuclear ribonucleoprotein Sm D3 n=1 Tax=Diutina rugosa TaxID=5481 RepID=A0A642UY59_DIURU|nr:uncharacterized protein DIURU_001567 [Diutina rugosa]KAA8905139.1 hypothetical protein DIURU_001567 [Diutina rugosa]
MVSAGIPVRLLNEARGHVISVELMSGDVYRGKLLDNEDSMNLQLLDVVCQSRNGQSEHLNQVYVRGSNIRFVSVPDMLKNAPMFYQKPGDKPKPPVRGPPPNKRPRH